MILFLKNYLFIGSFKILVFPKVVLSIINMEDMDGDV
jgi:hypothetical protein